VIDAVAPQQESGAGNPAPQMPRKASTSPEEGNVEAKAEQIVREAKQAESDPPPAPAPAPEPVRRTATPLFTISNVATAQRYLKALIYGGYGTGKTTLAATAEDVPDMQSTIFIDAEGGTMSIGHRNDIDFMRISNLKQMGQIHKYLQRHCQLRDAGDVQGMAKLEAVFRGSKPEKPKQYRTVVIDSLTEVHKYVMNQLMRVNIGEQDLDLEPEQAQWQEWGKGSEMLRNLVRSFRDLPMHVIFVCSEQNKTENVNNQQRDVKMPNLSGKLAGEVQGFMDLVGYLAVAYDDKGNVRRRLFIQPRPEFQAKNRFSRSQVGFISDPTMATILATNRPQAPAQAQPAT
jgi:hypothetical protein